jgi:hypothetical protein
MEARIHIEDPSSRSVGFGGDDMVDPDGWLKSPAIGEALDYSRINLLGKYQELDGRAQDEQNDHFWKATTVSLLALFAILVALVQIGSEILWPDSVPSSETRDRFLRTLGISEFIAGVAALTAVGLGIHTARHRQWLLNRHKAERIRYAKFHFLTSPDLWIPQRRPHAVEDLREEMRKIDHLEMPGVEDWLRTDELPRPPAVAPEVDLSSSAAALLELRQYYYDTRFAAQRDYLRNKARPDRDQRSLWRWKRVPQVLFFATSAIIVVHFLVAIWIGHHAHSASVILILLAVILPAVGASIRTISMAFEMGRNAIRSAAKSDALEKMAGPLRDNDDPRAILHNLWACEYIIQSDHREWLRLKIDAEWFG